MPHQNLKRIQVLRPIHPLVGLPHILDQIRELFGSLISVGRSDQLVVDSSLIVGNGLMVLAKGILLVGSFLGVALRFD